MIRTFIYGSCISRDTFSFLDPELFTLKHYVARQSLVSATSPPPNMPAPSMQIESSFQKRMVQGGWSGDLFLHLEYHHANVDLLLWDLCDERLGLWQLTRPRSGPTGAYVTRSVDSIRLGIDETLQSHRLIPFGSAHHRILFNKSLRPFHQTLSNLGLLEKTLLIAPAWATFANDGHTIPESFTMPTKRANRVFSHYHQVVTRILPITILSRRPSQVRAALDHKWGPAPFHYTAQTYQSMATEITEHVLRSNSSRRQ